METGGLLSQGVPVASIHHLNQTVHEGQFLMVAMDLEATGAGVAGQPILATMPATATWLDSGMGMLVDVSTMTTYMLNVSLTPDGDALELTPVGSWVAALGSGDRLKVSAALRAA